MEDGSAFAWGHSRFGGSSNRVQGQLKNVQQIFGSFTAFAAILADGSVVTWGEADGGGDSTAVQDRLRNVQQIQASDHAFAALLAGTVVSWGVFEEGLDTATYANYLATLRNVQKIQATSNSFAAIHADGSVNCWGSYLAGDTAEKNLQVHPCLGKIIDVEFTRTTCTAMILRDDGYKGIAWWGENDNPLFFGVRLTEPACAVIEIQSNDFAFAALLADGSVVSWGTYTHGGDSEDIQDQLKNIQFIAKTAMAFCAVTRDGKVVTWGRQDEGGDSSGIQLSCLM